MGSRLRIGTLTPVTVASISPYDSLDLNSMVVMEQIFERPLRRTTEGIVPELLAERLHRADRKIVATVRTDARFSDGSPVTAEDLVIALEQTPFIGTIADLSVRDGVIRFHSMDRLADLETELAHPWCAVAKRIGDRWLGTGPYRIGNGTGELVLVRNAHWRGEPGTIDEIHFVTFDTADALKRALVDGKVDHTTALGPQPDDALPGLCQSSLPGRSTAVLWINCQRIPDPRRRRSIAAYLDRRTLAERMHGSEDFAARSLLPPGIWADARSARGERPAEGRAPPKRTLEMLVIWGPRPYLPRPLEAAHEIANQLHRRGVHVHIRQTNDPLDYQARIREAEYDLLLGGWNADTNDPADFMDAFLHSRFVPEAADQRALGCNFSRWCDAETNDLLRAYRQGRRAEDLEALARTIERAVPFVPIAYGPMTTIRSRKLVGLEVGPFDPPQFRNATFVDRVPAAS